MPGELRRRESEVRKAYFDQAKALGGAGVDVIQIETFTLPMEVCFAIEEAKAATGLPVIAMMAFDNEGGVSDGTAPDFVAQEMRAWGADVVGANCNGPGIIFDAVSKMLETGLPVMGQPNAGRPQTIEDRQMYLATPENFGVFARRMFKAGVKIVGGCCGTNPDYIRRVASASRMVLPRQTNKIEVIADPQHALEVEPLENARLLAIHLASASSSASKSTPGLASCLKNSCLRPKRCGKPAQTSSTSPTVLAHRRA